MDLLDMGMGDADTVRMENLVVNDIYTVRDQVNIKDPWNFE